MLIFSFLIHNITTILYFNLFLCLLLKQEALLRSIAVPYATLQVQCLTASDTWKIFNNCLWQEREKGWEGDLEDDHFQQHIV